MRLAALLAIMVAAGSASAAQAPLPRVEIDEALLADMRSILVNEVVAVSLGAQNARHVGWDQAAKDAADQAWRAEREAAEQPLITRIAAGPLSMFVTGIAARSYGLFAEIFITDKFGLNAGISSVTSDFDQSDEAKYQQTFLVGANAVFIDEPEYNSHFAMWIRQVNMTISDLEGRPIGVAVFDVNLHELARRRAFDGAAS